MALKRPPRPTHLPDLSLLEGMGHEAGDAPCHLWVDHQRARKTGPCFQLTVVHCGLHRRAFTLYPPGHVPYGRIVVAPVSSGGHW
jgi:hypothetical protein